MKHGRTIDRAVLGSRRRASDFVIAMNVLSTAWISRTGHPRRLGPSRMVAAIVRSIQRRPPPDRPRSRPEVAAPGVGRDVVRLRSEAAIAESGFTRMGLHGGRTPLNVTSSGWNRSEYWTPTGGRCPYPRQAGATRGAGSSRWQGGRTARGSGACDDATRGECRAVERPGAVHDARRPLPLVVDAAEHADRRRGRGGEMALWTRGVARVQRARRRSKRIWQPTGGVSGTSTARPASTAATASST